MSYVSKEFTKGASMKKALFVFMLLVGTACMTAEKPSITVHWTQYEKKTYYSLDYTRLKEYNLIYLEILPFQTKYKQSFTMVDNKMVLVKTPVPETVTIPRWIPPIRNPRSGVIIQTKTISGAPYKK